MGKTTYILGLRERCGPTSDITSASLKSYIICNKHEFYWNGEIGKWSGDIMELRKIKFEEVRRKRPRNSEIP